MALYGQLVRNPGHAAGALGMMANWDLAALWRDLPALKTPLVLVGMLACVTVAGSTVPENASVPLNGAPVPVLESVTRMVKL